MKKITAFTILIGLTLTVVIYFGYLNREPQAPIVIYKATTPLPKTENRTEKTSNTQQDTRAGRLSETGEITQDAIHIEPVDLPHRLNDFGSFNDPLGETEVIHAENEGIQAESPFGYGPYPEVPADYPWQPIWTLSDEDRAHYAQAHPDGERGIELMQRVGIKLWQMVQNFTGIAYSSNGRVYPNFPDTVYVDVQQTETGTSISVTGSFISEEDMELIKNGGTPPGITVKDMSEGIEPFSFLDL
ncbi:MAG: hypothetical protein OXH00_06715 [Candidatus Poribacteria bacterium]|nr:hypothetical protein [Candidatus Poribacteria bacterium]